MTRQPFRATVHPELTVGAYSWESQVRQYPRLGAPGIQYYRGDVSHSHPGTPPVDCLLWRDETGLIRGILNHYPVDYPPVEAAGNVNVWTQPEWQRRGIARSLIREANRRWGPLDPEAQRYSETGAAMVNAILAKVCACPECKCSREVSDETGVCTGCRVLGEHSTLRREANE